MESILSVQNLKTVFHTPEGTCSAVDNVSFKMENTETLGIVGESGCGKSVTALSIMRLIPHPPGEIDGRIFLEGRELLELSRAEMTQIRGNRISMIFQEPMTSLNPVFTIGNQISEAIRLHQKLSKKTSVEKTVEMLGRVGIPSPEKRIFDYPHQLSGGMRQRAMIAMALACHPRLLIADEPTTALDVTIQAQILDLMRKLQEDLDMAIIFISHDLGVIAEMASRVLVFYAGKIVEGADAQEIFSHPEHPYTQGLLQSVLTVEHGLQKPRRRLPEIPGMVPNLFHLPKGCKFSPRCPFAKTVCHQDEPAWRKTTPGHFIACWLSC
jgi:peptide/nickel transport system ATP-binding protein